MEEVNVFLNMDCMEGMKLYPDKFFDFAIVDPPYGIGQDWKKRNNNRNRYPETTYKNETVPNAAYFEELRRVSKHQIIWGYNYYTDYLGSTNYLIVWDKSTNGSFYSEGEIAFSSKKVPLKIFRSPWDGYRMGRETGRKKIHPHQKPIELYEWILNNYASPGDKILDTHCGSAASLVACYNLGFDFVGFEIDEEYYQKALKRLDAVRRQSKLSV